MGLIITDQKLLRSVDRFFEKLEKYFPEHKVFALDSIDKNLREQLSKLYKETGCETADAFLAAYGFQIISGDEVRKVRGDVLYTPGNEPDIIKEKVESMLSRLIEYYPDRKITRGLQNDHKSLSKSVSGLYQWLGYANAGEMLSAYGFDVQFDNKGGRPSGDHMGVIAALQEKYKDGCKPTSVKMLYQENPEYAGQLKTLANNANAFFGMSLAKYFEEIGILEKNEKVKVERVEKKCCHYVLVNLVGTDEKVPCATAKRTIYVGDYIEMCSPQGNAKSIGLVEKTCYFTEEENLPCPVAEMQQYVRKLARSEYKSFERSNTQYIYCAVKLQQLDEPLYYRSPFKDIEAGDVVAVQHRWYGNVKGVVTEVLHVSEENAPAPIKQTKKIERIVVRVNAEKRKVKSVLDKIMQEGQTQNFIPQPTNEKIAEQYAQCAYFASAVFRGLFNDVHAALKIIHPASLISITFNTELHEAVGQFECDSRLVPEIIQEFPNLKCIFFAENWKEKAVYLAYSESGYNTVTDFRFVGKCDLYSRDRWSFIHDPTEQSFSFAGGEYTFPLFEQWEKCDYVLPDGKTQWVNDIRIPAMPYKKTTTGEPYQIITINYPENEIFYTPPEAPVVKKEAASLPVSDDLIGKIFVVTGDLMHYSSREELKAIIESAGGKLSGSVSSKTTALITNNPYSGTTKIKKAQALYVDIISEDEFIEKYLKK